MAVNDVYMLTVHQSFYGRQISNVYFYLSLAASDATRCAELFAEQVIDPHLLNIQSEAVHYGTIDSVNLFDPVDFGAYIVGDSGNLDALTYGPVMSGFTAWSFKCARKRRDMRAGFKRLAGVTEGTATQEGLDSSWADGSLLMGAAADALGAILSVPAFDGFQPVIVKRIREVDLVSGDVTYRLPESTAELVYYVADTWLFDGVTSQTSRKG